MEAALGLALLGGLTSGIVQLAKRWKVKPQLALGVTSLVLGLVMFVLTEYAPDIFIGTVVGAWGSANMVYELLIKHIPSK
jgi:hypothetical protein